MLVILENDNGLPPYPPLMNNNSLDLHSPRPPPFRPRSSSVCLLGH